MAIKDKFLIDLSKDYTYDKFSPSRLVKLEQDENGYDFPDYINSEFLTQLRKLDPVGSYVIQNTGRPDLISWNIYHRVDLWWIILFYNGLNLEDLVPGEVVEYPSLTDLEVIIHNLTTRAKINQREGS